MKKKTIFVVRADMTLDELRSARLFVDELIEQKSQPEKPKRKTRNAAAQPLDLLGLPKNLHGALTDASFATVGDVLKQSKATLMHVPGLHSKSVLQLQQALAEHGLALKEDRGQ